MKQVFLLIVYCTIFIQIRAQLTPATDTAPRIVTIERAERLTLKRIDSTNELLTGAGNVLFRDGKTRFYCDSAVRNKNLNIIEAFGNVHIIDSDTIHAYSKYLIYYSDRKLAVLDKAVKLTDGKGVLTTENLDYDTQLKIGTYKNGGKIVSGNTVITSREATYYTQLKDIYFKKDVKLKDPGYDLMSDSLLYNTETQLATFITDTYIKDSSGTEINTPSGYYDLKNKVSQLAGRSTIKDKSLTVTADDLALDDESGLFEANGNAVMIDTSQGVTIIANNIRANRQNNTFLATQHPLMILKQENDSIYVTADTLFSGVLEPDSSIAIADSVNTAGDSTLLSDSLTASIIKDTLKTTIRSDSSGTANSNRYFKGFYHVRIFSDSLQAVSDSLYYSGRDSVFRLFKNPILWANKSQATGDTIYLYTKNKKPERMELFENAMMINQAENDFFNQLKGSFTTAYFLNGSINYVETTGSPAESIYYVQDEDSAFVGMNAASARKILMYFLNQELNRVVYITEVDGSFNPPRQIPEEMKKLRDFNWQESRRPKTRFELFEDIEEPVEPPPLSTDTEPAATPAELP